MDLEGQGVYGKIDHIEGQQFKGPEWGRSLTYEETERKLILLEHGVQERKSTR